MELLTYFRVLRRRWALILVLTVVGAALGAASTQLDRGSAKSRTYYKATHTLVLNAPEDSGTGDGGGPSLTNIDQMAILATSGDIPDAVAKKLGSSETGSQLSEQIVTTVNPVTNTLDITATDADSAQAARISDAFADALITGLNAREQARFDRKRDTLTKQITDYHTQADAFLAALNGQPRPPDFDTIQRQYDATQNQYYAVYGEWQRLLSAGAPETALSSLTNAQAQPIDKSEYDARRSLGALGQNHLRLDGSGTPPAALAAASSSPVDSPLARGVLGGILGLLAGIGLALMMDRLDRRLRNRKDVEEAYGLPVLAEVPALPKRADQYEIVSATKPMSVTAEAYRAVQTSLQFQAALAGTGEPGEPAGGADPVGEACPSGALVIMVTSALPGEGKSATAANLATVFGETGASVLVVNCDFRRPTAHRYFDLEDIPRRVHTTAIPGVSVVTNVLSDPNANPTNFVAAQRQVVATAQTRFNVVILDTAPILAANDAVAIAEVADLVLLVARANLTTSDAAQRTIETLDRVDAAMSGVVFLGTAESSDRYAYYGYRQAPPPKEKRSKKQKDDLELTAPGSNGNGSAALEGVPAEPTSQPSAPTSN